MHPSEITQNQTSFSIPTVSSQVFGVIYSFGDIFRSTYTIDDNTFNAFILTVNQ